MRKLVAVTCLTLLLPACLTGQIWDWASDSYALTPEPVAAGLDSDGVLNILVATGGDSSPSFSLKIPSDWRAQTQSSVESKGDSLHIPLLLTLSSLPAGGVNSLTPTEEEWYLRHDFESGSIDVLTAQGDGHLTVGTAQLPSERHWGRITTATLMTPVTLAVDTFTFLTTLIFFSWLEQPFTSDEDEHSTDSGTTGDQPEGFIFPAKAPSGG